MFYQTKINKCVYNKLKCHQAQVFIQLDSVGQEVYVNEEIHPHLTTVICNWGNILILQLNYVNEENQTLMFIYYNNVQKTNTKNRQKKTLGTGVICVPSLQRPYLWPCDTR